MSENLIEKYDEIIKEYEQNKRCLLIKFPKNLVKFPYLPIRPVLREGKETTKIRAVFDESCALDG